MKKDVLYVLSNKVLCRIRRPCTNFYTLRTSLGQVGVERILTKNALTCYSGEASVWFVIGKRRIILFRPIVEIRLELFVESRTYGVYDIKY